MRDFHMSRADINEIKRHIDFSFEKFQRDMEIKERTKRLQAETKRDHIIFMLLSSITLIGVIYKEWDFWSSLLR
jgi:hypothetical protein